MELYSWEQFWQWIHSFVISCNDTFGVCIKMLTLNPFDGMNGLTNQTVTIIQGVALTLVTLFFLMEFFKKSLDLQWIKWENIFLFCIEVVFAKIIVDNTLNIMQFLFSAFNELASNIANNIGDYTNSAGNGFLKVGGPEDIVGNFLTSSEIDYYKNDGGFLGFSRLFKEIELLLPLSLIQLVLVVAEVIIFARIFEIIIYTMVSPIPLSTFIGNETRQIGLNFIKNYAAVCLQGLVLVVVFIAYNQMSNFNDFFQNLGIASGTMGVLFRTAALGIAVFKSGSWAKKMCGAM